MTMKSSTTTKIAAVIIYLFVALLLFDLATQSIITQDLYMLGIAATAIVLLIVVTAINRDERRKQKPPPSELEKY